MGDAERIQVEVAYAPPSRQFVWTLEVEAGATVAEALRCCGVLERFPEIDLQVHKVGVFSKVCALDTVLRAGDRVEIYRPLIADPKKIRRQRAAHAEKKS